VHADRVQHDGDSAVRSRKKPEEAVPVRRQRAGQELHAVGEGNCVPSGCPWRSGWPCGLGFPVGWGGADWRFLSVLERKKSWQRRGQYPGRVVGSSGRCRGLVVRLLREQGGRQLKELVVVCLPLGQGSWIGRQLPELVRRRLPEPLVRKPLGLRGRHLPELALVAHLLPEKRVVHDPRPDWQLPRCGVAGLELGTLPPAKGMWPLKPEENQWPEGGFRYRKPLRYDP